MEIKCPQCNKSMNYGFQSETCKCNICCITYFFPTNGYNSIFDYTFWYNGNLLHKGTFEECCKVFKLRCFI